MSTTKVLLLSNQSDYQMLYELLRDALRTRIEDIESSDKNLSHAFYKQFGSEVTTDEIIDFYTVTLHQEMIEKRRYCAKDPVLSDFYFLSRVIGSCCNAREKRNTFNSYFGDFLPDKKFWKDVRFNWINRDETENENGYWDVMLKLVLSGNTEKDQSGLYETLWGFKVEKLSKLSPEVLLDKFREAAKENIKRYNDEQWKFVDVKKFSPKSYNYKAFEEGNKLFSNLSRCIVQACRDVKERGGSAIWLKSLDEKIGCENNVDEKNIKSVIEEIGIKKWAGYGPALTQDFFKDMGFSCFGKADTHLINVLNALSIRFDQEHQEESIRKFLIKMASEIGSGVTANHIDKIIWLLRSGRFYKHSPLGHKLDEKGNKNTKKLCRKIFDHIQSSQGR